MSVHVFIVSRRTAPVKGFCKDFCPIIKNLEFYRNTQENCIFNLQKGCVLENKNAALRFEVRRKLTRGAMLLSNGVICFWEQCWQMTAVCAAAIQGRTMP